MLLYHCKYIRYIRKYIRIILFTFFIADIIKPVSNYPFKNDNENEYKELKETLLYVFFGYPPGNHSSIN